MEILMLRHFIKQRQTNQERLTKKSNYQIAYWSLTQNNRISDFQGSRPRFHLSEPRFGHHIYFLKQAQICILTTRISQARGKNKRHENFIKELCEMFRLFQSICRQRASTHLLAIGWHFHFWLNQKCPARWKSKQSSKRQGSSNQVKDGVVWGSQSFDTGWGEGSF